MARILITLQAFIYRKWFIFMLHSSNSKGIIQKSQALDCTGPFTAGSSTKQMGDALSLSLALCLSRTPCDSELPLKGWVLVPSPKPRQPGTNPQLCTSQLKLPWTSTTHDMAMAVPSAPAESPSRITLQWNTADAQAVSQTKLSSCFPPA